VDRRDGPPALTGSTWRSRRWLPDLLGVAWIIVAAGVMMAPALVHGWSLGPFDQLSQLGLTQHAQAAPHNSQPFDLIREIIPWTTLSWTQVHHGYLPLWNPYSALGSPLAFNWQSSTFSLPALFGYLVPVRLDFTVQVLITLVIGGTGAYVLGRVMRLGVLGATMAATVFELSGSFTAVLGWPIAATVSWSGWMLACVILTVRGGHRRRDITLLAVVGALSIYAGQPDTLIVVIGAALVFLVVLLAYRARRQGAESLRRPLLDVALASAAGLGLAAPLVLPASQLSEGSIRAEGRHNAFPLYDLLHVVFQTFNGTSLAGSVSFDGHGLGYISTAAYVGVIPLVLAVMAVVVRRHKPAVIGVAALTVVMGCLVYLSPLVSLLNQVSSLAEVRWVRAIVVLDFGLAVLAGVGLDVLVRSHGGRAVRRWLGAGFGTAAALLLVLWLFGRGHLRPIEASIRSRSFIWPAIEVLIGLAVVALLVVATRWTKGRASGGTGPFGDPGRTGGVILLLATTVLLVALGSSWWSSNTTYVAPTTAVTELQRAVGTSIVGFGTSSCLDPPTLGIQADLNAVYGVHEIDSYDPLTPKELYTSWKRSTGHYPLPIGPSGIPAAQITMFCPVVTTTAAARLYGIGFVLEPHGDKGPPGSVFDRQVGDEELYRIPGVSVATITRLGDHGSMPPVDAGGQPVAVSYPTPTSWKVTTKAASPQELRLRLTDVPGWHATIDGRPLTLTRFDRIMLQARIPAGNHTIELHYWPDSFNTGIVLAALTVVGLVAVPVFLKRRRRNAAAAVDSHG
jgi:hypothetical protein